MLAPASPQEAYVVPPAEWMRLRGINWTEYVAAQLRKTGFLACASRGDCGFSSPIGDVEKTSPQKWLANLEQ
eukprot:932658-Amphidinium_carterae.2